MVKNYMYIFTTTNTEAKTDAMITVYTPNRTISFSHALVSSFMEELGNGVMVTIFCVHLRGFPFLVLCPHLGTPGYQE